MGKSGAAVECVACNGGKAVRKSDGGKLGAATECAVVNVGQVVRKSDVGDM